MDKRPEQPPEGKLIEDAAEDLDISIREAAKHAGLSYGRWRQIVKGYQNVSPGVYAEVRNAPATTVARMAMVAGVSPELMETKGQRPDVADAMRRRAAAPARPVRTRVNASMKHTPDLDPYIHQIAEELAAGDETSDAERIIWDSGLSVEEKWNLAARLRQASDTSARESEHGTGLTHPHLAAVPGDAAGTRLP